MNSSATAAPSTKWSFVLVFGVAVVCYLNAFGGDFVFDDIKLIVNNEVIKSASHVPQILFSNLWGQLGRESNYYRPLPPLLFMVIHSLFGLRPEPYHAANAALHAGSAGLVFLLARQAFGLSPWSALVAGLIFAVHPLHTEAVAWISGVMDLACTFFSLLALWAYARSDGGESRKLTYMLSLIALFLALVSKEPAAVLPFVVIAFDVVFHRVRITNIGAVIRRWGALFGVLGVYLVLRTVALGGLAPVRSDASGSWKATFVNVPTLVSLYVEKLVLPVGLSVVHDFRTATSLLAPDIIAALAVLGVSIVVVFFAARMDRRALFAAVLFVFPLLPALDVPALSQDLSKAFAERYAYLPSVGAVLFAGTILASIEERRRLWFRPALLAVFAIVVVFAGMTVARNAVWKDSYTLWSDCVSKSPNLALAHENLGLALIRRGQPEDGTRELKTALRLDPTLAIRSIDSGIRAARSGQFLQAILAFQTALAYDPRLVDAHYNLGVAFETRNWVPAAVREYRAVLALRPGHPDAHNNLGVLLAQAGDVDEAITHFEAAARARPEDAEVRTNLRRAYDVKKLGGRGPRPTER